MHRICGSGYREPIAVALRLVPTRLLDIMEFDFFCGVDPVFAGLHSYPDTPDGRSYKNTAHVAYPCHITAHADRRRTTLVLPTRREANWATILHEMGHVLDYRIGFSHTAKPVTPYAEKNRREAFAEAFVSWLVYGYGEYPDPHTVSLLKGLPHAGQTR